MIIHVHGQAKSDMVDWFVKGLLGKFGDSGISSSTEPPDDPDLVFNILDPERPRPFRRRGHGTFVAGIISGPASREGILHVAYPHLIRSLSNLLIYLVEPESPLSSANGSVDRNTLRPTDVWFITPEQGHYGIVYTDDSDQSFFESVFQRVAPIATARLVIDNVFIDDLEPSLYLGDEITRALKDAGRRLEQLNLLPAPFPLEEFLPPREIAHIQRLYSMGGLSYGNLSARKDEQRFWMSASGVDKSNLSEIGRDILLVKGYDEQRNAMVLSVPKGIKPRRVSVDAIEHWMIYTENPGVGAIIHIHAWMEGITSTQINYPCGTYELGASVAALVREAPDPSRAVIGLKNHGLTVTGTSLEDIFSRIEGHVLPQVPMTS